MATTVVIVATAVTGRSQTWIKSFITATHLHFTITNFMVEHFKPEQSCLLGLLVIGESQNSWFRAATEQAIARFELMVIRQS